MSGESQLLEEARAGSLPAFDELVSAYEKKIYNYCLRMTNSREDAEDLTQEVFIKVYRSLKNFKGNSQLSTWIYRIAHNICIDNYRRNKATVVPLTHNRPGEGGAGVGFIINRAITGRDSDHKGKARDDHGLH